MKPFAIFFLSLLSVLLFFETSEWQVQANEAQRWSSRRRSPDTTERSPLVKCKLLKQIRESSLYQQLSRKIEELHLSFANYVEDVKNRRVKDLFRRSNVTLARRRRGRKKGQRYSRIKRELENAFDSKEGEARDELAANSDEEARYRTANRTNSTGDSFHRSQWSNSLPRISKYMLNTDELGDRNADDKWWNEIDRSARRRRSNIMKVPEM